MMEFVFLLFSLVSSQTILITQSDTTTTTRDKDWNDVVVTTVGRPVTLACADWSVKGAVKINWLLKSPDVDHWKLVLTANERKEFSGGSSKSSMRLADPNFKETGNFSLHFTPKMKDEGRYSCLVQQQGKKLRQRITLLAILTVSIAPSPPIPQVSILRLIADLSPVIASSEIMWLSPHGSPLQTRKMRSESVVAKLPRVYASDNGVYTCVVYPRGNSSKPLFSFPVKVTMDESKVASFTNVTHGSQISTASLHQVPLPLPCPPVVGDYVLVYWKPPDRRRGQDSWQQVFEYDRWRGLTRETTSPLRLAGPPASRPEEGDFSFLLTPGLKDAGLYSCEVFVNDNVFIQRTQLSVLRVRATSTSSSSSSSSLELTCQYTERSQVKRAGWTHHNRSHRLTPSAPYPGSIVVTLPLPLNENTAGNYTCTLQLNNGQTVKAVLPVAVPPKDGVSSPSLLLPSLSALLLLAPLVAAAAAVLLWRQGHIARRRGIEQSLSHYSGEVENIYENPEDIRQAAPQGPVYMDLKPRGEDDVYKELDW